MLIIGEYMEPLARITADTTFGSVPFKVHFKVEDLFVEQDEIVEYNWHLGNGTITSEKSPIGLYSTYGSHSVLLSIKSNKREITLYKKDFILGLKVAFTPVLTKRIDSCSVSFLNNTEVPKGCSIVSWDWNFGDGIGSSIDKSPTYIYRSRGLFTVSLGVTIKTPEGDEEIVSVGYTQVVSYDPPVYNRCSPMVCLGWVKRPSFSQDGSPLYPLAIADTSNVVLGSNNSLKFSIEKDGDDHFLEFMGSVSSGIKSSKGISLDDGDWHSLVYTCVDDYGTIVFYVDGIKIDPKEGYGEDGFKFSIAHGEITRPGGGNVWAPHLYKPGQGIQLFNWRLKMGHTISESWIHELLELDKKELKLNTDTVEDVNA